MNHHHLTRDGESLGYSEQHVGHLHYLPHTVLRLHRVDWITETHHGVLQPQDSASSPPGSNSSEYMAHYYPTIGEFQGYH